MRKITLLTAIVMAIASFTAGIWVGGSNLSITISSNDPIVSAAPTPRRTPAPTPYAIEATCSGECFDVFWDVLEERVATEGYFVCSVCMASAFGEEYLPTPTPEPTPSPTPTPTPSPTPTPEPTSVPLPLGWSKTALLFLNVDNSIYHTASDCDKDAEMFRADELTGLGCTPCDKCFGKRSITTPKPYTPRPTPRPTPRRTPTPKPTERAYLYITDTGEKYHIYGCQYLRQSCNGPYTLSQVIRWGYDACSRCDP